MTILYGMEETRLFKTSNSSWRGGLGIKKIDCSYRGPSFWFTSPVWWLTTVCKLSLRGHPLLASVGVMHACGTHTYTQAQTYANKQTNTKANLAVTGFFLSSLMVIRLVCRGSNYWMLAGFSCSPSSCVTMIFPTWRN